MSNTDAPLNAEDLGKFVVEMVLNKVPPSEIGRVVTANMSAYIEWLRHALLRQGVGEFL